ncbi:MAG: PilN domain-containing protein [Acidobacteriota bacterium]
MSLLRTLIPDGLKKWLVFGHGVGIEVVGPHGGESLRVTAVRVHPGGAREVGTLSFDDAIHHAGVWGTEYAAFVRKHGCAHVAATVLLPRREVMVRHLALPGVSDKDLAAAIEFQMEGLHPYREEDVMTSWARIPGTSSVLIAITRRAVIERFVTLFGEAGIQVGTFTCSAAAIYAALRMFRTAPLPSGLLAYEPAESGVEIYGESASRPAFSATFDVPLERAAPMSVSELRLEADIAPVTLAALLNTPVAMPYAAALSSACPLMALPLNLLPAELRPSGARWLWIPSAALGAAVLLLAVGLALFPRYDTKRYLASLNAEIARVAPVASRSTALDRQIEIARRNSAQLDALRGQTKSDMDVLAEMTRILAPPAWLNLLEINRTQVTLAGETPQAAPLLGTIDASPLFQGSEFVMPPARVNDAESFRIRTNREPGK